VSKQWVVTSIDPACDCCSYVQVGPPFATLEEAQTAFPGPGYEFDEEDID
jgi:hypothetical protein